MNSPKRKRQSCLKSAAFETPQTRQVCKEKTEDGRNQEKDSRTPGINVSVRFCNLKINYSVCRLVETYLDYKKCIKSGPSLDFSLVSFISSVSLLSGSIWLYLNKNWYILWEWQQTGWGDILVWWTEQRCGVKSIFWWLDPTWLETRWLVCVCSPTSVCFFVVVWLSL